MPAFVPRAMPDDLALLRVLEAVIETLKAKNEILKRQLAAVETRATQETAKAEGAIAALTELLTAQAAKRWPWRRLAFRVVAAAIATTLIWPGR